MQGLPKSRAKSCFRLHVPATTWHVSRYHLSSVPTEPSEQLWAAVGGSVVPQFHLCYLCEVRLSTLLKMVLLIARPANSNRSMVKVCFHHYVTDETYF